MTDFGTRYGVNPRVHSNVGSRFEPEYSARFTSDGQLILDVVGRRDVFEDIQSWADSCDLQSIIRRYNAGDTSVLQRAQGFFGDISGVPDNFPEIYQIMADSQRLFDSLSPDERSKFANDFRVFLAASVRPSHAVDSRSLVPAGSNPVPDKPLDDGVKDES